ncbi:FAD-dependent monooxygenase [Promicromonospora sp. MEB111]|uniref:FAD-dependent monooxygenase n=1 Tax=Promicromonospora sp. MEB111 TaxID=3040301 RepID=UPI002549F4E8|nr:FAD-dependent monooxygenase [Promicromonospora sp. MEB111]
MSKPRALVVGTGIGGLATALRLHDVGWESVLVERASERRGAGYFVGMFGTGQSAAARLGVLDAIGNRTDPATITYDVERDGRRRPGMGYGDLPGMPQLVLRGDIEGALYDAVAQLAPIRFGTTPVAVEETVDGVDVTLRGADGADTTERFDLVVGADGLRSTVRRLAFGPDADYLRPFDHIIGVSVLKEAVPGFRPTDGIVLAEPGRSAWVFPFTDHEPTVLFSYRTDDEDAQFRRPPAESLRRAFGPEPAGPVLGNLLDQFEAADDVLFDSVHQVVMPSWHTGRVVLLGDSAWCVTLYSGMGASSAMAGADLLGTVLQRNPGNPARALREWELRMRPFIATHQRNGRRDLVMFVPQTRQDKRARTLTQTLLGNPTGKRVMQRVFAPRFAEKSLDVAAA